MHGLLVLPPRRVSQSFLGLRDRRCVSLRLSHVCPRTVLGFCVGSCPSSSFSSCWKGVSAVAVLHGRRFPVTVQRPIPCGPSFSPAAPVHVFDVPCVSQVVCSLGHADDMPVVGNNRCLELDSVVLQRFRSCNSLVVCDVSVVAGAGSYGPDCSVNNVADVLVMHSCRSHRCGLCFRVFSRVPGAGPFLSCTTSSSTLLVQGVLRAAQGLQTFRLGVPRLSHAYGCFRSSFLWSSILASMIFAVMGFFSAKDSKVSAIMVSFGGVRAGVLFALVCVGHVHALTQLTCQWTQLSCRWTHLSCHRTQLWSRRTEPSCRRTQP